MGAIVLLAPNSFSFNTKMRRLINGWIEGAQVKNPLLRERSIEKSVTLIYSLNYEREQESYVTFPQTLLTGLIPMDAIHNSHML